MLRRDQSSNDDSPEEMIIPAGETFAETSVNSEDMKRLSETSVSTENTKRSSLKKKREKDERTFLKSVSSDASFSFGDFEMDGDGLEAQIMTLQEQLFSTIIENHNLVDQLKKLKSTAGASEELLNLLEREREKNKILSENLREKGKLRGSERGREGERERTLSEHEIEKLTKGPRSNSRGRFGWRKKGLEKSKSLDQSEFIFLSPEDASPAYYPTCSGLSKDGINFASTSAVDEKELENAGVLKKFESWLWKSIKNLLEDLSEISDESEVLPTKEEPLTVRKLRENVYRFGEIIKPINDFLSYLETLFHWRSPASTFLLFVIYIYALINGYLITLGISWLIFAMTKNYIRKRGYTFRLISTSGNSEIGEETEGSEVRFGDKFLVVFQVARRVQNVLGTLCDTAEKLKNLFLWEHEATRQLYVTMWVLLVASITFYTSQLATLLGIYLGLKFFLVDFVFFKFPRIRYKFDSSSKLWDSLPTDSDLDKRNEKNNVSPTDLSFFLELFNLPSTEIPIQGWQSGKRCTLINRDKSLTSAFRNGRLYLTCNYLCFERSKTNSDKNIKLAICDVISLDKANSYPWIPGGGMAIDIVTTNGKAYFFGGIINRDEVFDSIMDNCRKSGISLKKKEREKEKEKEQEQVGEEEEELPKDNQQSSFESHSSKEYQDGAGTESSEHDRKMNVLEFID